MEKFVVVLDTPSVKKYIFESSSLKDIRGASAILDGLNRGWLLAESGSRDFTQEQIYRTIVEGVPDVKLDRLIFANGGSGLMIVSVSASENLQALAQEFEKRYREHTKEGVALLAGWHEYEPGNFQGCLEKAHWHLRRKRSQREAGLLPSTPWVRYDDELKGHRAEVLFRGAGDSDRERYRWISEISKQRKEYSAKYRKVWEEFQKAIGHAIKPPETLEQIAGEGNTDIAVVYADGNAMGKYIRQISDPKQYALFSEKIDSAVRGATFGTLQELFPHTDARFDIILLGGDDILLVLPPEYAGDFVVKAHRKFVELAGSEFSLSFGISVANCHYPFYQMVEQAATCLKTAKSKIKGAGVDFHLNRVGFYPDVDDYREKEFVDKKLQISLTCRPMSIAGFEKYLDAVRKLKQEEVPFSRLYGIACELKKGKNMGHIGWIQGVGRAREKHRKGLLDLLWCWSDVASHDGTHVIEPGIEPWVARDEGEVKFVCGFHDILELYDLVR